MNKLPLSLSFLAITALACVSAQNGGAWRTDALKRQAQSDFECSRDALTTYESAQNQFSVRGCGKRALYQLQNCNRVTRECSYVRRGDVLAADTGASAPRLPH